jgi:NDP-sugar pyrophosphorylase family protein
MPTLLEQQIGNGKEVNMFPVHEYWLDIGRMEDFQRAQSDISGLFNG